MVQILSQYSTTYGTVPLRMEAQFGGVITWLLVRLCSQSPSELPRSLKGFKCLFYDDVCLFYVVLAFLYHTCINLCGATVGTLDRSLACEASDMLELENSKRSALRGTPPKLLADDKYCRANDYQHTCTFYKREILGGCGDIGDHMI